jgi:NAD(P)-dependent dehydrogenase (short-subunit alcohol dehydrogenase family)
MAFDPDTPIVLISGANQGIGLATAKLLAEHKYHVIIGSRDSANGEKAASDISSKGHSASSVQLDINYDESIAAAVEQISNTYGRLDVLINNAGILLDLDQKDSLSTREIFSQTFSTNVVGAACLTNACLALLSKSQLPRLIFVSSRIGSIQVATEEATPDYFSYFPAYRSSKAALNMLAMNYARILQDKHALVNVVCPGLVQSNLCTFNYSIETPPSVGAKRIVELATMQKGGATATFTDENGTVPW